jgi:hypothetical protein
MMNRQHPQKSSEGDATFTNLPDAFDFTAEDIDANRGGIITPRQRARLQGMGRGIGGCSLQGLIGMTILVAVVGAFISYGYLSNAATRAQILGDPANLVILLAAFAIPVAMMLGAYFLSRQRANQLGNATVRIAEGDATIKRTISAHGGAVYVIKIGTKKFNLLEEYGTLFKQGASYRVYYAKAGPYEPILSIEEVE